MEQKIRELAAKYKIPESLLQKGIELEKEKIVLQNRRLVPKLVELIEHHSESL